MLLFVIHLDLFDCQHEAHPYTLQTAMPSPSEPSPQATLTQTLWTHVKSRHSRSNRLVNLKLAVALSARSVYSQLVRDFYEVFRTFEGIWQEQLARKDAKKGDGALLRQAGEALELFGRTKAFEKDLRYYLGAKWAEVSRPTETALAYAQHIRETAKEDPDRLLCYIYAFYSGLMAGGWVLRRKIIRVVWRLPNEADWAEKEGGTVGFCVRMRVIRRRTPGSE